MTKAIRLQKDDELLIVREQKRILQTLNNSSNNSLQKNIAFPFFPIFAELNSPYFSEKSVAELKKSFKSAQIENAIIFENKIVLPINIIMNDDFFFSSQIVIGTLNKKETNLPKIDLLSNFQKKLRIFQLTEIKKTDFITEFWNCTWVKM